MKIVLKILILTLIQIILIYLIFLYMTKEWNPITWDIWFRISFGALLGLITIGTYNSLLKLFDMFERLKTLTDSNTLLKEENKIIKERIFLIEKEGKLVVEDGKKST